MSDELNMSSVTADPAPETAGKRAAPEEKPPKTPGKRAGLIIGIAAAVLVLAYAGCCVAANALYSHTAFPNTSVLGMDMSGLSAQEAEQRWTEQGSALLDGMTIRLTRDGQEIGSTTLSDLGVTVLPVYVSKAAGCDVQDRGWGSDVTAFLRGGWRFIESWFRAVDVTPQLDVDEAKLTAACEQLSDTVGCTVTDGGYRLAEGEGLYITKPQDGEKLDAAALRAELVQRFESRDLSAAARSVECVFAAHTAAPMDVQALHDEIAGTMAAAICDKSTGKPTQSRVGVQFDVETVQKQLDVAQPGEEFWYNATVGQRTEARGFQPAAAYSGGKTVTSIGGGICQVSSTLYYSALMADLQIVLRYAHMFDPGYMPVTGCDATVSWGGPDFAFRNSTNYPIKITTSYNDETNQLTITLLGTKTDDHYVEMTNQFLSYSERKTVYQESERIAPGTTEVEQYGHNGYAVQTYRNVYAGDGTLLRSTKEAYSDYDRADKIILVAPGELPQ